MHDKQFSLKDKREKRDELQNKKCKAEMKKWERNRRRGVELT